MDVDKAKMEHTHPKNSTRAGQKKGTKNWFCTLNKMLPGGFNLMDQQFSHTGLQDDESDVQPVKIQLIIHGQQNMTFS